MTMINIIFREKSYRVLMQLLRVTEESKSLSWLSWNTRINFSHITVLIKRLGVKGIVATEKKGRLREVTLTKNGYILATGIKELIKKLDENEKSRK